MVSKTKSERHKRFLESGFFPAELPPPFVSSDLARHRTAIGQALKALPRRKNGDPWHLGYVSSPEVLLFPKSGRSSRQFTILNPISFYYLSKEISDNWTQIKAHLKKSKCSISTVVFDWDGPRTFLRPNFGARASSVAGISLRHAYLLHSDISRYYHSIYTHAIPWALHTKKIAKRDRSSKLLGNRLDTLVRNGQDGQTIGLPVGPDTSRVLAEMLGVAIDRAICDSDRSCRSSLIRFVDDLTVGATSLEHAERLRNLVREILHSYQLEINEDKTEALRVLSLEYASWRHELALRMPKPTSPIATFELFFDTLLRLSDLAPRHNVALYALKKARRVFIAAKPWRSIENFLLMLYRAHPVTLPTIVEILANRNLEKGDVDLSKVAAFIGSNLQMLIENDRIGELAWFLFLAKALRVPVQVTAVRNLRDLNSSVCALILCDLESRGLVTGSLDKSQWNSSLNDDGLRSEMWLYAYEGSIKGWTGKSDHFLTSNPQFRELHSRGVSFYGERRHLKKVLTKIASERQSLEKEKLAYRLSLDEVTLDDLSGIDEGPDTREEFMNFEGWFFHDEVYG